jgi:hypothetical protein
VEVINKALKHQNKLQEEFSDICCELVEKLPKEYPLINKNSKKKSLIVETRKLKHNEFVIKNTIQKLGDGWGHIVYCHKKNYSQIKYICDDISPDIEIRLLDFELTRNSYNNLMLDINFWNEIDCEKCLVYQTDTFLFRPLDDKFLEWDWIGSPWSEEHSKIIQNKLNWFGLWGCNGGLNIRTVSVIKEILNKWEVDDDVFDLTDKLPEDLYYSWYIKNNYKLAPLEISEQFSYETVKIGYKVSHTFGCHQPWHASPEIFKKFVKIYFQK